MAPQAPSLRSSSIPACATVGASLGYQLSGVLSGAFAPLIATALLASFGGASWPVALYLAALALVSLVGAYLATETYRSDIYGGRPREREAIVEG